MCGRPAATCSRPQASVSARALRHGLPLRAALHHLLGFRKLHETLLRMLQAGSRKPRSSLATGNGTRRDPDILYSRVGVESSKPI